MLSVKMWIKRVKLITCNHEWEIVKVRRPANVASFVHSRYRCNICKLILEVYPYYGCAANVDKKIAESSKRYRTKIL